MADLPTAYPLRDLFDAAVRGKAVKLTCRRCRHTGIFNGHCLWWHFQRRGWSDRFADVQRRAICTLCWFRLGEKMRGPALKLVDEAATVDLPPPSELDWKRELRRRR
jgi:hypothetical protein